MGSYTLKESVPIDDLSIFIIPGKVDEDTIIVMKDGDLFAAFKDGKIIAKGKGKIKTTESGEYCFEIEEEE